MFQTKWRLVRVLPLTYIHTHYASSLLQIIQRCVLPCLIRIHIQVQPSILKVGYLETHAYTRLVTLKQLQTHTCLSLFPRDASYYNTGPWKNSFKLHASSTMMFQTKWRLVRMLPLTYIHTHYTSSLLQIIQCCVLPCLIRINIQVQPSILKVGYLETHIYTRLVTLKQLQTHKCLSLFPRDASYYNAGP